MNPVLLAGVLASVPVPSGATQPFTFDIPDGWTNISSWAPPVAEVPIELATQASIPDFVLFAANLEDGKGGFVENVNVTLQPCPGVITDQVIRDLASVIPAQVKAQSPAAEAVVLSAESVTIGGIAAGRMTSELRVGEVSVGQVMYLLPNEGQCATLTYSASLDEFEAYLPKFDASANKTVGLARTNPPLSMKVEDAIGSGGMGALIGGGVALALGVIVIVIRRR